MKNIIKLVVLEHDNNLRLDKIISERIKDISRTRVKKIILNENVLINNKIIKDPAKKISTGDLIQVQIPLAKKASLKPFNFKLDIIYEDSDLMIINKPSGISMHPGAGNYDNTIVNALMNLENKKFSNIGGELRPGIVHRIDKDTSGLIVIAKNNNSHEKLSNQFEAHSITRVYEALIWGKLRPRNGKIETLITRSSKNRQKMEVGLTRGKKAVTHYQTLEIFEHDEIPTLSLIECTLETGRTHQIRVHMGYKSNYILGDQKYKKKYKKFKNIDPELEEIILNLDRQFLHAKVLGFTHPKSGKRIQFSSKLPQDLEKILKKLRNK